MKALLRSSLRRTTLSMNAGFVFLSLITLIWMNGLYINADILTFGGLSGVPWKLVQIDELGNVTNSVASPIATAILFGLATLGIVSLGLGLLFFRMLGGILDDKKESHAFAERIAKTGAQLEIELESVARLLSSHIDVNANYASALGQFGKNLATLSRPDQLRKAVMALLIENEKARNEASALKVSLEQSHHLIEKLRVNLEDAHKLGLRDPLTSLKNRRWFDLNIDRLLDAARTDGTPLCLVMSDIDNFKRINDTYGHLVGDDVLQRFAQLMVKNIKGRDSAVRYGGEEFVLVLPETNLEGARKVTEQIRRDLESKSWFVRKGGQELGKVTASFGLSQFRDSDTPEDLMHRADNRLYQAKRSGRNLVVCDDASKEA